MKAKEKILIFGGSGFLGKAFLDSLNLDNLDITIVDSSKSHIENNLVNYVEVDITDLKEMQSKLEVKQRELDLRRELAAITNTTRQSQSETQAATKIATTAMANAARAPQQPDNTTLPGPINLEGGLQ